MKSMHWFAFCLVMIVSFSLSAQNSYAQRGKGKSESTLKPVRQLEKTATETEDSSSRETHSRQDASLKSVNVFIHPLALAISKFEDLTLSIDVRFAKFATVGVDYSRYSTSSGTFERHERASGGRLRVDVYLNGRAFTSSFVAQLNYTFLNVEVPIFRGGNKSVSASGPGLMFGGRWFWTDPGNFGLNVGLLLGASKLDGIIDANNEIRIELGCAF